jgi:UDP-N-acetylglucosamine transferase subunit ALG13
MIFVTVGTSRWPFDRLVWAAGKLGTSEPVFAQCGATLLRPQSVECVDRLTPAECEQLVREARVVVTHAGIGSIASCIQHGRRPVVVPRLRALGESIDDHQLPFARRLADLELVTIIEDVTLLQDVIASAKTRQGRSGLSRELAGDLITYIAQFAPLQRSSYEHAARHKVETS